MKIEMKPVPVVESKAYLHCPICTHTVPATVEYTDRRMKVVPGQKCQRCHASLDAAALLYLRQAA